MKKPKKSHPKIRVFTTPICPFCYTLKEFFKKNNIEFEEVDITQDEKLKQNLIKKTGKMEVPMIEINGQIVVGFDKEKISKLLNIK